MNLNLVVLLSCPRQILVVRRPFHGSIRGLNRSLSLSVLHIETEHRMSLIPDNEHEARNVQESSAWSFQNPTHPEVRKQAKLLEKIHVII